MATTLVDGFYLNTALPLDLKSVMADLTARDAIPALHRYVGLAVYVVSEQMTYRLKSGITNGDWEEDGGGGTGGGVLPVADYTAMLALPDDDRYDGLIVYVIDVQENWQLRGGIDDLDYVNLDELYRSNTVYNLTASGTVADDADLVTVDATGGDVALTLPATQDGKQIRFLRIDNSANTVTLNRAGSDQIMTEEGLVTSWTLPYQGSKVSMEGYTTNRWGAL